MDDSALLTSIGLGAQRVSSVGNAMDFTPSKNLLDVPATLEGSHAWQIPGSSRIGGIAYNVSDSSLDNTLLTALLAETPWPMVVFTRGTAGGACELIRNVRVSGRTINEGPDIKSIDNIVLAAGSESQPRFQSNGLLFDHTIAHSAGVSGAVSGAAVQVGAVSSTQSMVVYYGNLHSPAPTITTADALLESASDSGFTTDVTTEATFTQVTSTASYELVTLAGPITNTYWRLRVTDVVDGVYWPVLAVAIYTT